MTKMIGYILLIGSLIGANMIGYNMYKEKKAKKIRRKYRDVNGKIKEDIVITLKPEDIKEVRQ